MILRIRDSFSQTNKEVEILRKEIDVISSERNELLSICEKQQRELENAKHAITDLREQVIKYFYKKVVNFNFFRLTQQWDLKR